MLRSSARSTACRHGFRWYRGRQDRCRLACLLMSTSKPTRFIASSPRDQRVGAGLADQLGRSAKARATTIRGRSGPAEVETAQRPYPAAQRGTAAGSVVGKSSRPLMVKVSFRPFYRLSVSWLAPSLASGYKTDRGARTAGEKK